MASGSVATLRAALVSAARAEQRSQPSMLEVTAQEDCRPHGHAPSRGASRGLYTSPGVPRRSRT